MREQWRWRFLDARFAPRRVAERWRGCSVQRRVAAELELWAIAPHPQKTPSIPAFLARQGDEAASDSRPVLQARGVVCSALGDRL